MTNNANLHAILLVVDCLLTTGLPSVDYLTPAPPSEYYGILCHCSEHPKNILGIQHAGSQQ